ncbi:MarR family winged helix-turn-helix transcriptional regulator [Lentibacillus sp. Marseille-P4043]|uniref:MarR family winged helix-turn-helix transcriptional regulator n=1 Tax=Lentibacillus sp. Marseille-P4043 TaxID=2040293 RepID=UPI00131A4FE9|nr:MarR family transcriptional regulator [Lentibacillus sp. Marseille-P4043]
MNDNNHEFSRSYTLMQSFWRLHRLIMQQVKQTAAAQDLSMPQFAILITMTHYHQIAQKRLQELTNFPKSTLSHAIDGLVQAGLLNRTFAKDNRREMDLSLSAEGKALIQNIKEQKDGVPSRFQRAVDSFSAEEFNQLLAIHRQLAAHFEEGSEEPC